MEILNIEKVKSFFANFKKNKDYVEEQSPEIKFISKIDSKFKKNVPTQ